MKLKDWRLKKKLSQAEFACGVSSLMNQYVSQRTISAWENGAMPRREWLIAIDKYTNHKVRAGDFV